MFVIQVHLSSIIRWKFREDSPSIVEIQNEPYLAVINPFSIFLHLREHHKETLKNRIFRLCLLGEEAVLITDALAFTSQHALNLTDAAMNMTNFLPQFLEALRCVSGQGDIPLSFRSLGIREIDLLPAIKFPDHEVVTMSTAPGYLWSSAVTAEDLREVKQLLEVGEVPAYSMMLMDAVRGYLDNDHKKCLIYCAMAMEIVATSVLTREYNKRIQETEAKDLRIIVAKDEKGEPTSIDPVYKLIERNSSFRVKLHELPLYLFGRSLLLEDKNLYDKALEIYKTRNEIVHEGTSQRIQLSFKSVLDTLDCTQKIFHWFGEGKRYSVPSMERVEYYSIDLPGTQDK